jgi:von Willebrand factor type A domain/von Willebrand factor type A C-terminal domain
VDVTDPNAVQAGFRLRVHQNKYRPFGDSEVHAIIEVTAGELGPPPDAAEVILVDCSASMGQPETKIAAARRATAAAVALLRDGTLFAIVRGGSDARQIFPSGGGLATASPATRTVATAEVAHLSPSGGTRIGTWLLHARALLAARPAAVRHAILLTDGRNEHETPAELDAILASCAGEFSCDARGIGDHWDPRELRRIVARLQGTADGVRETGLADDFRAMMAHSMAKVVPDLRLTVREVAGARVRFVRQVFPVETELAGQRTDERTIEYATGSWRSESREYHLCLDIDPAAGEADADRQFGVVSLQPVGPDGSRAAAPLARGGVLVRRTDDLVRATRIEPRLGYYQGQDDLRAAVNAGCDAFDAGDLATAAAEWGRAARLAYESGHQTVLTRLDAVVHLDDPAAGRVRLRDEIRPGDVSRLETGSTFAPAPPGAAGPAAPTKPADAAAAAGPDRRCAGCGRVSPPDARICTVCGRQLEGPA